MRTINALLLNVEFFVLSLTSKISTHISALSFVFIIQHYETGSAETRTLSQRALRCQPRKGHECKGADRVGDHAGEQKCVESAVIGWTQPSDTLFFVDELIGEHHERDGQDNDTAGAWPGIDAAEKEIGGEESARKQDQGRNHDSDPSRKPQRQTPPTFSMN